MGIEEAIRRSMQDQTINKSHEDQQSPASAQSMYSSAMEAMMQANMHQQRPDNDDDDVPTPSGTLTPTEDGQSTAASLIGSQAEDIGRLSDFHSMADDNDMD